MEKLLSISKFVGWDPTTTDSSTGKAYEAVNCDFGDKDYAFRPRKSGSYNKPSFFNVGRIVDWMQGIRPIGYLDSLIIFTNAGMFHVSDLEVINQYTGQEQLFDPFMCEWGWGINPGPTIKVNTAYGGGEVGRHDWTRTFWLEAKNSKVPNYNIGYINNSASNKEMRCRLYKSDDGSNWVNYSEENLTLLASTTGTKTISYNALEFETDCLFRITLTIPEACEITSVDLVQSALYGQSTEILSYSGGSYTSKSWHISSQVFGDAIYYNSGAEQDDMSPPIMVKRQPGVSLGSFKYREMGCPVPSTTLTATASATAGSLSGTYLYKVAYINEDGSYGNPSATSAQISVTSKKIDLSQIPVGPTGNAITKRVIYRTKTGGAAFYKLTVLDNNTATTYVDDIPDTALVELMETDNYEPPVSKIIHIHKNIMFFVDHANPNKLWFSKVSGYFSGSTNGGFECVPLTYYKIFPDTINGLATLNGDLIVSGETFTHAVSGDIFGGPLDDTKIRTIANFGTVSHNGMALCIDRNMKNTLIVPTKNGLIAIYNGYENSIDVTPFGGEIRAIWSEVKNKDYSLRSIFHNSRLYIFGNNESTYSGDKHVCIVYDFDKEAFVGIWTEDHSMEVSTVHLGKIVLFQNTGNQTKHFRIWDYGFGYAYRSTHYAFETQQSWVAYSFTFDKPATIGFYDYDFEYNSYPYFDSNGSPAEQMKARMVRDQTLIFKFDAFHDVHWVPIMYQSDFLEDEIRQLPRIWGDRHTYPRLSTGKIRYGRRGKNLLVLISTTGGIFNIYRLNLYGFEGEE